MIVLSVLNCSILPQNSITEGSKRCKYINFHVKERINTPTISIFLSKSLFSLFISFTSHHEFVNYFTICNDEFCKSGVFHCPKRPLCVRFSAPTAPLSRLTKQPFSRPRISLFRHIYIWVQPMPSHFYCVSLQTVSEGACPDVKTVTATRPLGDRQDHNKQVKPHNNARFRPSSRTHPVLDSRRCRRHQTAD